MDEQLQLRVHGDASLPTLIYLPGLHGDWTLIPSFRAAVAGRARFVEMTYPRTTEWSLEDYAAAIEGALAANGITGGWLLAESFGSQPAWAMLRRAEARGNVSARLLSPALSSAPSGGEDTRRAPNVGRASCPPSAVSIADHDGPRGFASEAGGRDARPTFTPAGLILAGGFVRHPADWMVRLARRIGGRMPLRWITRLLFGYAKFARFRHRHAPETLATIDEFITRRTEADRAAAVHRLDLILGSDLRRVAATTSVPVFALTGLLDPIVPWPWTLRWLRRHCPALRATRIIRGADHNVLSTAPREAAEQVLAWMTGGK